MCVTKTTFLSWPAGVPGRLGTGHRDVHSSRSLRAPEDRPGGGTRTGLAASRPVRTRFHFPEPCDTVEQSEWPWGARPAGFVNGDRSRRRHGQEQQAEAEIGREREATRESSHRREPQGAPSIRCARVAGMRHRAGRQRGKELASTARSRWTKPTAASAAASCGWSVVISRSIRRPRSGTTNRSGRGSCWCIAVRCGNSPIRPTRKA